MYQDLFDPQGLLSSESTQTLVRAMMALYPQSRPELNYKNHFELLCAVVLSAQTTDVAVNKVTPALFAAYPTPQAMAQADVNDIASKIQQIGLYRNKGKFLKALGTKLVEDFQGIVPQTREELTSLPGVGRKTANVVLAAAFGIPAFAVDTHIERVTKRFKMVEETANVRQVEAVMMDKLPEDMWARAHHSILLFGRYQCTARKHDHEACIQRLKDQIAKDSKEERNNSMMEEKSCGAIVYHKENNQINYLLIQHTNGNHWSFPKGHVEDEETEEETALREIKEETGLEVSLDSGLRMTNRFSPKEGVMKDVIYFMAQAPSQEVINQEGEVMTHQWLDYDASLKTLTYDSDRDLLRQAQVYLNQGNA